MSLNCVYSITVKNVEKSVCFMASNATWLIPVHFSFAIAFY